MLERLLDAEQDPKLKHAHSFDLDKMVKHQRDLAPKDRRLIEEYYNSQVKPTEDGEETPLVLNIRSSTEMLPITVRDPIRHLQQVHEDLQNQEPEEHREIRLTTTESEILSMKSVRVSESVYSLEFEEEVMGEPYNWNHIIFSLLLS